MNTKYESIVKKIILQKPNDRDLFFNSRYERLNYLLGSTGLLSCDIPLIHVVGTKGKGSTASFLSNILNESKYSSGMFTSPHLHRITERIKTNLIEISKDDFINSFNFLHTHTSSSKINSFGGYSFFETLMTMALLHFKKNNLSLQILEAGIGGTHDSTNFVKNKIATLITNISLDHQNILGSTLNDIAKDKAGAISENSLVISAPQKKSVENIIYSISNKKRSRLLTTDKNIKILKTDLHTQSFKLETKENSYNINTSMLGKYQTENIGVSILAIEELAKQGFDISKNQIESGIEKTKWTGRLEIIKKQSNTYFIDGAHNTHSINQLIKSLKELSSQNRYEIIFGATYGHSFNMMINKISKISDKIYFVKSRHPKSVPTSILTNNKNLKNIEYYETGNIENAIKLTQTQNNKKVLITGSLSVVSEALEYLNNISPELYPYI
jgi:dihydrofolate synthase/folylpolyglutamate synthase